MIHSVILTAVLVAPASAVQVEAGDRPARRLGQPQMEFPQPFTTVKGLQVLPDRRIVLADTKERKIFLVDLLKRTAVALGRIGAGPREYQQPGNTYRAPGGGAWVYDQKNSRFFGVSATGQVTDLVPLPIKRSSWNASDEEADQFVTDTLGNVYTLVDDFRAAVQGTDTLRPVIRITKRGIGDTLARLIQPKKVTVSTSGNTSFQRMIAFSPQDLWTVSADGWVAVVKSTPYHVEWYAPDGKSIRGRPVPFAPVKVTQADRDALEEKERGAGAPAVSLNGGAATTPRPRDGKIVAAEKKPAFPAEQLLRIDESGRLWVERSGPAAQVSRTYDVFDRRGELVDRVELPAGSRLIGFDRSSLYAVRIDGDDLLHLQQFKTP